MPLNKLENFIKNYEGRILYVNSNDLDATDSVTNQGNSLAKPFKTIQRALIESARFSFVPGENNDKNDRTTILVFPGDHVVDNRPGWGILDGGVALANAKSPSGAVVSPASNIFDLSLQTNFDLTQEDNALYKFNSVNGGVVIPRGTSIVGLDLRKTKIKPKYVPNPTDDSVPTAAIFRVTGNCFFWNFSFFDADSSEEVYTDNQVFTEVSGNKALPTFSHHKLTCFEYCDGVNIPTGYEQTDLDMYYAKLSNAFNQASDREIPESQKFPLLPEGFSKIRSEWEIVGAFATDPVQITDIFSGDRATANSTVTVTTNVPHGFTVDTPITIRGVNVFDYNISTVVQTVPSPTTFTYQIQAVRNDLPADPGGDASVIIDTDTVKGSSPYVFNCSLRSVWGMNGMHADGSKASGFRSMVVAQFTAISLQKDDRAFVKYDPFSKTYLGVPRTGEDGYENSKGSELSSGSAQTDPSRVYHLDADAIYRRGWETSHIRMSNDAIIQIVSVFAIGFNKHFVAESGGDASITNSNSNFGQIALSAEGFKKESFSKDNYGYITSIITPKSIKRVEQSTDWLTIDIDKTTNIGISSHLYLFGFTTLDNPPPSLVSGAKVGAREDENLNLILPGIAQTLTTGKILMTDNVVTPTQLWTEGTTSSIKEYQISQYAQAPNYQTIVTSTIHDIQTGEKIVFVSDTGELPDNIEQGVVYYAIRGAGVQSSQLKVATSLTNAINGVAIKVNGGANLRVLSRVIDKDSGDFGHPIQFDENNSNWFIHVDPANTIYTNVVAGGQVAFDNEPRTNSTFVNRIPDPRSLDERLYKVRIVVPKEAPNAKAPAEGFVIQETSKTAALENSEFTLSDIGLNNFDYKRNYRYIANITEATDVVTVTTEVPHSLKLGDRVFIKKVKSTENTTGLDNKGYNGDFIVTGITNHKQFTYSTTDIDGIEHNVGVFTQPTARDNNLPFYERNDLQSNLYVYRVETITPYGFNAQDGVYHAYVLKADRAIPNHFTDYKYSQNVVDLYPQQDRDNIDENPPAAFSYAKNSPLGDVVTNDLKKSITREALDTLIKDLGGGLTIDSVGTFDSVQGTIEITFDREHRFNGINDYTTITGNTGNSFAEGTTYNVRLLNQNGLWNGATATITVNQGQGNISSLEISDHGCGYINNQILSVEGFSPVTITVTDSCISKSENDILEISGIGTASDNLLRIASVTDTTTVAVARTSGDPIIVTGQYATQVGPSTITKEVQFDSSVGITTFIFEHGHMMSVGNKFKIVNDDITDSYNVGDFFVKEVVGVHTFTATTTNSIGAGNVHRIMRYAFNANDALSNASNENIGSRGHHIYDGDYAILNEDISAIDSSGTATFAIETANAGIATVTRFDLGSYILIDSEILRVSSDSLSGSGNDKITAIRGYFGTSKANHKEGALIKKIKVMPIELRRPSILRASGHTFEYLGFGPGNYSTGLPQIQVKTLTDREDYLAQSQERSGGSALYTGMNSDGDFFIGNTKLNAQSGEEESFDIPVATVTGQDPSRLSVLYDEAIIKERIVVEGGKSKQILSQFDGPVNFSENVIYNSEQVKVNALLVTSGLVRFNDITESQSSSTGSVVMRGGLGVLKNLNVGGDLVVTGITTFDGDVTFNQGLIPESVESAYIGTEGRPWSQAWIGGIGIATEGVPGGTEPEDRLINGWTGDLLLTSTAGIVSVTDDLTVGNFLLVKENSGFTGVATFGSDLLPAIAAPNTADGREDDDVGVGIGSTGIAFRDAHIGAVQVGYSSVNTIDTSASDLILDSSTDEVYVDSNLTVNKVLTVIEGSTFSDQAVFEQNIVPKNDDPAQNSSVGSDQKRWSAAYIDAVEIGVGKTNQIYGGHNSDLILDSDTNKVHVEARLFVDNDSEFSGIVTVKKSIQPNTSAGDGACGIGSTDRRFTEAFIDDIQIGWNGSAEIDTRTGDLTLDSNGGTVIVDDHLDVNETLNVDGQSEFTGIVTFKAGILPDAEDGAYIGNADKPFEKAWIGEIGIGTTVVGESNTTGNSIVSRDGYLYLDSAGGRVLVDDTLDVTERLLITGTSDMTGVVTVRGGIVPNSNKSCGLATVGQAFSHAHIGDLELALGTTAGIDGQTISTRDGSLYLSANAASDDVISQRDFTVQKKFKVEETSILTGIVSVTNGIWPTTTLTGTLGTDIKPFKSAFIGQISIGATDTGIDGGDGANVITTEEANTRLFLDSTAGTVQIMDNLEVDGTSQFDQQVDFKANAIVHSQILPDADKGASLGAADKAFSQGHFGNISIAGGVNTQNDDDNLIYATDNELKLDAANGKVDILNDLEVSRNADFANESGFTTFRGSVYFRDAILPPTNEGSGLGNENSAFGVAYIDEIIVDENKIVSRVDGEGIGQNLKLEPSSGIVEIQYDATVGRDLSVTGITTLTGDVNFDGNLIPANDSSIIGTANTAFGAAYIDNLLLDSNKLSVVTADTNLELQAGSGTGVIDFKSQVELSSAKLTGDVTLANSTLYVNNASEEAQITLSPTSVNIKQDVTITDTLSVEKVTITGLDGTTARTGTFLQVGAANASTASSSKTTGSLVVYGGAGINGTVYASAINASTSQSTLNSLSVTNSGSYGGSLTVNGTLVANGGVTGTVQFANRAQNVAGGSAGRILYQSGANVTTSSGSLVFYTSGSTRELRVGGDIVAFYSSDERFKDNIKKIDNPLEKVLSIGGYTFDWNEKSGKKDYGSETGVIAQEIEKLGLPGVVETREDGHLAVRYDKLVPLLIESIKELSDKVSDLEERLGS